MAHQTQLVTTKTSNSNHLSGISDQLQECIKSIKYDGERYKNDPIRELIPEDIRDEYLKINNLPFARKWHVLYEGLEEYSMSRKEADSLESNLKTMLHALKEWEGQYRDLMSENGNVTVDGVMDIWLFGRIIIPVLRKPGRLLEQVEAIVDMVEEEAEIQAEEVNQAQEVEEQVKHESYNE